jgi:MFS family permease
MTTADAPALTYSSARGRWVLVITVLGSGIASLDATVVNIALPTIGRDFDTGISALQWVMNGYTLTLAAFLLIGGSLGDRFGRRKVYLIGIVWFALASAASGLAPGAVFLIAARVLQGAGAALLTPGSLAILEASFVPADRARAIGTWSGLSGVAVAAGPLFGGYLISAASWRWIFFINVPIAVTVIALGARHVPESRDVTVTARSITRVRWPRWCSSPASRSRSSRPLRSADSRPPCWRWGWQASRGWPRSWSVSAARPRRCCPCRFSWSGSSSRPTP